MQEMLLILLQIFSFRSKQDTAINNNSDHALVYTTFPFVGPGSVVGIATGYGLDGPGIEDEDLNETERNAWLLFKRICKDFLGNHKAANYQDVVQDLLTSCKAMGCNMSLKIHFLE